MLHVLTTAVPMIEQLAGERHRKNSEAKWSYALAKQREIDYAYVTLLMRERQSEMDVGVKMNTFMYMRVGG